MKAQAALEFLTTYGFLFIIVGIVLSALIFIVISPTIYLSSSCTAQSGPYCAFVQLYSNTSQHFSLLTFVLTNSESVPINVTQMNIIIRGKTFTGYCTPSFLVSGQSAVCVSYLNFSPALATFTQGFYSVSAKYCNSGITGLYNYSCSFSSTSSISYSGYFSAEAVPKLTIPISMLALQGPKTVQVAPYPGVPEFPPGYLVMQNGYIARNITNKELNFSFGTPGYQTTTLKPQNLNLPVYPFPSSVSSLNALVSCGYNPSAHQYYNSTYSIFATTLYFPTTEKLNVSVSVDDIIQVYYKPVTSNSWSTVIPSGGWWAGICCEVPKSYYITVSPGLYNFEVLWGNLCAPGLEIVKISNFTSDV